MRQTRNSILRFTSLLLVSNLLFIGCVQSQKNNKPTFGRLIYHSANTHELTKRDVRLLSLDELFSHKKIINDSLFTFLNIDTSIFGKDIVPDTTFKFQDNFFYQFSTNETILDKNSFSTFFMRYFDLKGNLLGSENIEVNTTNLRMEIVEKEFYLISADYTEKSHSGEVNHESTDSISIRKFYHFENRYFSSIDNLSAFQIEKCMNNLYARKGMIFDDPELSQYYNEFSWYNASRSKYDIHFTGFSLDLLNQLNHLIHNN